MRPLDIKRIRRADDDVPPEIEAELEALDRVIAGAEPPPGMEDLAALAADLRVERPASDPDFDGALDAWAAAGFPRSGRPGLERGGHGAKPGSRLTALSPRGWLPVAAAAATLIVVAGVSISQLADDGPAGPEDGAVQTMDGPAGGAQSDSSGAGEALEAPATVPEGANQVPATGDSAGSRATPGALELEKRRVERDAALTLLASADEVAGVADEAIEVVESADGIVRSSRVIGEGDTARATLRLLVPAAGLDQVLAELTDLATVGSRTDEATDVTGAVVNTRDRLIALRAERESLAGRLADAESDDAAAELRTAIARINRRIARERSDLTALRSEVRFAAIDLEVTSEGAGDFDGDEGWSFGEALDDAGKVLEVAAGVALISAAVLLPLALIAAITYIAAAAIRSKARERALDD